MSKETKKEVKYIAVSVLGICAMSISANVIMKLADQFIGGGKLFAIINMVGSTSIGVAVGTAVRDRISECVGLDVN